MTTYKHSPGPWWAGTDEDSSSVYAVETGDSGEQNAVEVASTLREDGDDVKERANALLTAAAPEMLAALESALAWMTNVNVSDPATVGRQIMAAMEKAGYDKETLDAAAVALVRGPCSVPNMMGEEEVIAKPTGAGA